MKHTNPVVLNRNIEGWLLADMALDRTVIYPFESGE